LVIAIAGLTTSTNAPSVAVSGSPKGLVPVTVAVLVTSVPGASPVQV
jgi:hypothetical protein